MKLEAANQILSDHITGGKVTWDNEDSKVRISKTVKPDKDYTYNEISNNVREQLTEQYKN